MREIRPRFPVRPLNKLAIATAVCLMLISAAAAQSSDDVHVTPVPKPEPTAKQAIEPAAIKGPLRPRPLRHDVDLVLVPVTVTDSYNRVVTGLDKKDFRLLEAEKPQQIRYFSTEDAPISLGVLLDLSSSMKDKISDARDAAVEFFESSNPDDDYFVITFSDMPRVLADSTRSIADVRGRLATAEPKGRTALLDAIYLGIEKMQRARYGRRALLIISDGGDNNSRYTDEEVKDMVEEADVQIYSIGIFDDAPRTDEEREGPDLLSNISEATGGRLFQLDDVNELPDVASKIGIQLRNEYVVGYVPAIKPKDGEWHKIRVKLMPPKGLPPLSVYAKKGYYAPATR